MKKLLIATTALVATAGMASADITITGHAAAGIYSGLANTDSCSTAAAVHCMQQCCALQLAYSKCDGSCSSDVQSAAAGTTAEVLQSRRCTMTGATDNGISFSASVNMTLVQKLTQAISN